MTSAGRRTKLVEYFNKELLGKGKLITADCSPLAPALYKSDQRYLIPPITDKEYLPKIIDICSKEKISAVLSLIDPELHFLAKNRKRFDDIGVTLILSNDNAVDICNDKIKMHTFIGEQGLDNVKTFDRLDKFLQAHMAGDVSFPVFVKERWGSASSGTLKINTSETLKAAFQENGNLIVQEFIEGRELGVDVYVDLISKEVISVFIKEKFNMRAGETDKAASVINSAVTDLVVDFVKKLDLVGPLDMDIIERNGRFHIIDINSRFGGGYPLAYECGENYPLYVINNLRSKTNMVRIGQYPEGVRMMKHDDVVIIRP